MVTMLCRKTYDIKVTWTENTLTLIHSNVNSLREGFQVPVIPRLLK
jgi:hypothetical protein